MIRMYTDNDLDGLGCAIALRVLRPDDKLKITYCGSKRKISDMVSEELNKITESDLMIITDIPINEKTANKVEEAIVYDNKRILLFDHHSTQMWCNKYPWACVETEIRGREYCAMSLLVEYLYFKTKPEILNSLVYQRLLEIAEYVRLWDTWNWQKTDYLVPKYLNYLIDILGKSAFIDYVVDYITMKRDVLITDENMVIINYLLKKFNDTVSFKNMNLIKMEKYGYKFGVTTAESNISELGNALCKINPDLDFIAIVNQTTVSYRSIKKDIDVSKIAKELGGGGREQTAANPIAPKLIKNYYKEIFKI